MKITIKIEDVRREKLPEAMVKVVTEILAAVENGKFITNIESECFYKHKPETSSNDLDNLAELLMEEPNDESI